MSCGKQIAVFSLNIVHYRLIKMMVLFDWDAHEYRVRSRSIKHTQVLLYIGIGWLFGLRFEVIFYTLRLLHCKSITSIRPENTNQIDNGIQLVGDKMTQKTEQETNETTWQRIWGKIWDEIDERCGSFIVRIKCWWWMCDMCALNVTWWFGCIYGNWSGKRVCVCRRVRLVVGPVRVFVRKSFFLQIHSHSYWRLKVYGMCVGGCVPFSFWLMVGCVRHKVQCIRFYLEGTIRVMKYYMTFLGSFVEFSVSLQERKLLRQKLNNGSAQVEFYYE